jgi:2-C-methyl-D-erythritol 4-phosphate cytidylyltransferase
MKNESIVAIVPAAGIGSRMMADRPKQYLPLLGKTVLEQTVNRLLALPYIHHVIVVISCDDPYFPTLAMANDPRVIRVVGGKERVDSVRSGVTYAVQHQLAKWVLVHDAARPCFESNDVDRLIEQALSQNVGAILASPVTDTMKRGNDANVIQQTVDRRQLWHALTPQCFQVSALDHALEQAMSASVLITDEASALEFVGCPPLLVPGKASNIKITQPEDLALAEFYLSRIGKEHV